MDDDNDDVFLLLVSCNQVSLLEQEQGVDIATLVLTLRLANPHSLS